MAKKKKKAAKAKEPGTRMAAILDRLEACAQEIDDDGLPVGVPTQSEAGAARAAATWARVEDPTDAELTAWELECGALERPEAVTADDDE